MPPETPHDRPAGPAWPHSDGPDDTMLMAYADGELDAATARDVAAAIAADPALARRAAQFRRTRELVAAAVEDALGQDVPDALLRTARTPLPPTVAPGLRLRPRAGWWRGGWRPAALAASLALLIGLAGGQLLRPSAPPATQLAALDLAPIARALEVTPSGASWAGDGMVVELQGTFQDAAARWCRELVLDPADGAPTWLIACRDAATPRWSVRLAVPLEAAAGADYRPAGGDDPLQPLLDQLGAGRPVDAARERELIEGGWR
jgi:hypothetical protein